MRKPDFLVIGAQKAGTTTIHNWLATQPNLCLPGIKETHYFSHSNRYSKGPGWYKKQFKRCAENVLIGEVDPDYLYMPDTVENMAVSLDSPKFIVIFREPIKRAFSHYRMSRRRGYENLNFLDAINAEKERMGVGGIHSIEHHSYISRSLYSPQVKRFISAFPESKFYFVKFEDLFSVTNRKNIFTDICQFIGFLPDTNLIDFETISNKANEPRYKFLRDVLYNEKSGLRNMLRPFLRLLIHSDDLKLRITISLDKINRKKSVSLKKSETNHELPLWLKTRIADDLRELEDLTKLDFSNWISSL